MILIIIFKIQSIDCLSVIDGFHLDICFCFHILQLPENKRIKAYNCTSRKNWDLAILEANVLQCVKLSNRIEFYDKILMNSVHEQESELRDRAKVGNRADTPQTVDTAYSSMKQSVSPASLSPTLNELELDRNYDVDKNINNYLKSVELSRPDELPEEDLQMDDGSSYARMIESPSSSGQIFCPLYKKINDKLKDDENVAVDAYISNDTMFASNLNELCSELKKYISTRAKSSLGKRKSRTLSTDSAMSASTVGAPNQSSRQRKLAEKKAEQCQPKETPEKHIYPIIPKPTKEQIKLEKQHRAEQKLLSFCMKNQPINFILKGLPKDPVCQCCLQSGNVMKCIGKCNAYFHEQCFNKNYNESGYNDILKQKLKKELNELKMDAETAEPVCSIEENVSKLQCQFCTTSQENVCFVCSKSDGECIPCCEKHCGKAYHIECLKYWPQHKKTYANNKVKSLSCSRHVCHTCVSPDIRSMFHSTESDKKLIKCLQCPGTYHRTSECIPAGSELLSETQLICARHQPVKKLKRINIDYCLFCSLGGTLVCCDACVYSFHQDCLNVPIGELFNCEVRMRLSIFFPLIFLIEKPTK